MVSTNPVMRLQLDTAEVVAIIAAGVVAGGEVRVVNWMTGREFINNNTGRHTVIQNPMMMLTPRNCQLLTPRKMRYRKVAIGTNALHTVRLREPVQLNFVKDADGTDRVHIGTTDPSAKRPKTSNLSKKGISTTNTPTNSTFSQQVLRRSEL